MARGSELFKLMEYAHQQGISMSELAHRAISVRRSHVRKESLTMRRKQRFEVIHAAGRDWWNT